MLPKSSPERPRRVTSVSIFGMPTCPQNSAGFKFHYKYNILAEECRLAVAAHRSEKEGFDCWSKSESFPWGKNFQVIQFIFPVL
jgi:hypothetical protein